MTSNVTVALCPCALAVYVPALYVFVEDVSFPSAFAKAAFVASCTAVLVTVAPETISISEDCLSRISFCNVSRAAPPTAGVSSFPSTTTSVILSLSTVSVTVTSPPKPFVEAE